VPFSVAAVAAGLYGRVLLPDLLSNAAATNAAIAAETALPSLAREVLPDALFGALLAGVFAATLSTADSQILACSASITQDILPRYRKSYLAGKIATLSVAALALAIALSATRDVFSLVLGAWSALGATIGPLLLVRLANLPLGPKLAFSMMALGLATVIVWPRAGLSDDIFELLPGTLLPLTLYAVCRAADVARSRVSA
jgi:sodium/proline symporter